MKKFFFLFILAFFSCTSDTSENEEIDLSELYNINNVIPHPIDSESLLFLYKNTPRLYRIYEPDNINDDTKILFHFHWWGGSVSALAQFYPEFISLANENNYILVYPQGLPNNYDGLNQGTDKGAGNWWCQNPNTLQCDNDDTGFIASLANKIQKQYDILPSKTFASGISMGAVASFLANQKASEYFNGVSSWIGGTMESGGFPSNDIFPVLMFDGIMDPFAFGEGNGSGKTNPFMLNFWPKSAVDQNDFVVGTSRKDIFEYYAQQASCSSVETIEINQINTLTKYSDCVNDYQMWRYEVKDWGHTMPDLNNPAELDYASTVFEFFNQF